MAFIVKIKNFKFIEQQKNVCINNFNYCTKININFLWFLLIFFYYILNYFLSDFFFINNISLLNGNFFCFTFFDLYILGVTLFILGLFGLFVVKRNLLVLLFSLELIFFSLNFFFLATSIYLNDLVGYIMCLAILVVVAADSAIGLGILISFYRFKSNLLVGSLTNLKG